MKTKHILILGAGFGGLTLASELDELAAQNKISVTLIDKNPFFQMGFSMQWVMMGRRAPEEGSRPYQSLAAKHVRFIRDSVEQIDVKKNLVQGRISYNKYDILVIALGATYAPRLVPGLSENAHNLCDVNSVIKMREQLDGIEKGDVVVMIASVPFKCPPAPYEYALLIDDLLRQRNVRHKIQLKLTTPEPQPMPVAGPTVGGQMKAFLAQHHIDYFPGLTPRFINPHTKMVVYQNGYELNYTLLAAMYPHRAPAICEQAGLTEGTGFIPVELGTFKVSIENVDNIYAIGDVAVITLPNGKPHPKAGFLAELQAKTVASLIKSEVTGGKAVDYLGQGFCFIDVGDEQAAPAEVNLLASDGPKIVIHNPSPKGLAHKLQFERERLKKWFSI